MPTVTPPKEQNEPVKMKNNGITRKVEDLRPTGKCRDHRSNKGGVMLINKAAMLAGEAHLKSFLKRLT